MQVTTKLEVIIKNFAYHEPSTSHIELHDLDNITLAFSNATSYYNTMSFRVLRLVKL